MVDIVGETGCLGAKSCERLTYAVATFHVTISGNMCVTAMLRRGLNVHTNIIASPAAAAMCIIAFGPSLIARVGFFHLRALEWSEE